MSDFSFVTAQGKKRRLFIKVRLHRRRGPAILPSDAISIENILSPRHRFEMDIPFEIYAPRNSNHIAQQNRQPHIACVNTPLWIIYSGNIC